MLNIKALIIAIVIIIMQSLYIPLAIAGDVWVNGYTRSDGNNGIYDDFDKPQYQQSNINDGYYKDIADEINGNNYYKNIVDK